MLQTLPESHWAKAEICGLVALCRRQAIGYVRSEFHHHFNPCSLAGIGTHPEYSPA